LPIKNINKKSYSKKIKKTTTPIEIIEENKRKMLEIEKNNNTTHKNFIENYNKL